MLEEKETNGQIQISDEVIAIIAGTAATETEGVSLPSSAPVSTMKGFFGKKNQSKGVKVTVEEKTALIELELTVKFGINIKNVCEEVQQKVKNAVETMTGLTVSGVNIIVSEIAFEKEISVASVMEETTEEEITE
ncbi:hypothetical protein SDC9_184472 [bioreactor metagenome]|uniref:Alkaline shock protein 23 n=1 Tax=bioreactor metagenome TaxID=1076179 RepID=A0A645HE13_9ZZZZ|nr:Asp23/Gls24 family envelope stress response protein [Candidatus Metalachnospira sp.]